MWKNLSQPYYFAHRGASAHAPENTLAAFQLALQMGAPAIEFDVKLSADGQVVVIHDPSVDRTTNGTGKVKDLTLEELQSLDAGSWFAGKYEDEKIPSLDDVFSTLGRSLFMNVELTNYTTPSDGLVVRVCELVKKHSLEEYIMFSSFFPTNLIRAKKLLPTVPRGQLAFQGGSGWWQRAWARFLDIQADHPALADVSENLVQRSHARARRVHAWTVNDPADMRRLRNLGVDAVFTDDPLLASEHFILR